MLPSRRPADPQPSPSPPSSPPLSARRGPGPFRGPAEQHPLQHRQLGVHPLQLGVPGDQHAASPAISARCRSTSAANRLFASSACASKPSKPRDSVRFRECTASHHEHSRHPGAPEITHAPHPACHTPAGEPRARPDHKTSDYLRFDKADGLTERERLWAQLEVLWPSYQVLSAWTEVMHAAYVFATEGHESLFMDDIGFFTTFD